VVFKQRGRERQAHGAQAGKVHSSREKPERVREIMFDVPGDVKWCAGRTVMVQGFGKWDGKYRILQVIDRIGCGRLQVQRENAEVSQGVLRSGDRVVVANYGVLTVKIAVSLVKCPP
jgi:hypothetical protein